MEVLFQGEISDRHALVTNTMEDLYVRETRRTISWEEPFYGGIPLSNIGIDPGRARKVIVFRKNNTSQP